MFLEQQILKSKCNLVCKLMHTISEGSYVSDDWSDDAKNTVLYILYLKIY